MAKKIVFLSGNISRTNNHEATAKKFFGHLIMKTIIYPLPRKTRSMIVLGTRSLLSSFRVLTARLVGDANISNGASIESGAFIQATDGGSIFIGEDAKIRSGAHIVAQHGHVALGRNVHIGCNTMIVSKQAITFGDDVLIAERVTIRDQDHAIHGGVGVPISKASFETAPIVIGDDVWIAAGAVILKGVSIGRGAVVAANAVVNRDVADYEIVGGVPARHIGMRDGHDH